MGAPIRFLFDNDFATPPPDVVAMPEEDMEEEVPKIDLEIHLQELKHAEAVAFERGFAEGQQNAQAEVHEQLTLKTQRMSEAADKMITLIDGDLKRIEADALVLTATIAKKIAGFALTNYTDDQIMGLIAECLAPLRNVRHLAIRVNEAFVDRLKEPIESLAAKNGFEGRLLILGEPETKPGDCRIEWADGGILFERAVVVAAVDAAIIDHLGEETVDYETGLEMPADAEPEPGPEPELGPEPEPESETDGRQTDEGGDDVDTFSDFPTDEDAGGEADGSQPEDGVCDEPAPSGFDIPDLDPDGMDPAGDGDFPENLDQDDIDSDSLEMAGGEANAPGSDISNAGSLDNATSVMTHPEVMPQDAEPVTVGPKEDER